MNHSRVGSEKLREVALAKEAKAEKLNDREEEAVHKDEAHRPVVHVEPIPSHFRHEEVREEDRLRDEFHPLDKRKEKSSSKILAVIFI